MSPFPAGSIGYVQLPTTDLDASIAFYRALGAVAMDEWTTQRLTGEALHRLARG